MAYINLDSSQTNLEFNSGNFAGNSSGGSDSVLIYSNQTISGVKKFTDTIMLTDIGQTDLMVAGKSDLTDLTVNGSTICSGNIVCYSNVEANSLLVVNDASFNQNITVIGTITNTELTSLIGTKATDTTVVHNTGIETIAGAKTFSALTKCNTGLTVIGDITNTGLTNLIATKATDTAVVHNTGIETIAGAKTFSALTTCNTGLTVLGSITNTTLTNLIATKATDTAVVHNTGIETIAGAKTFSDTVTCSGALVCNGNQTFGNAEADTLVVNSTADFKNNVTLGSTNADTLTVHSTATFDKDATFNTINVGLGGGSVPTNTSLGNDALYTNSTGLRNTAVGFNSHFYNTSGCDNTAVGAYSLNNVAYLTNDPTLMGGCNTAIGCFSGNEDRVGSFNTYLGYSADQTTNTGNFNYSTAIGAHSKITSDHQIILGTGVEYVEVLGSLQVGGNAIYDADYTCNGYAMCNGGLTVVGNITNTALTNSINLKANDSDVVHIAGIESITGAKTFTKDITCNTINVGLGGGSIITNTSIGNGTLHVNSTGNRNTAVGYKSQFYNTTGSSNTSLGCNALNNATLLAGDYNTAIGAFSGNQDSTGSYNTYLGYFADQATNTGTFNRSTAVGYNSKITASNQVVLGTASEYVDVLGSLQIGGNITIDGGITCASLTAYVETKAVDTTCVHNTGTETIAGVKTFSSNTKFDKSITVGTTTLPNLNTMTVHNESTFNAQATFNSDIISLGNIVTSGDINCNSITTTTHITAANATTALKCNNLTVNNQINGKPISYITNLTSDPQTQFNVLISNVNDNSTQIQGIITNYAPLLSPTFTGTPHAPTQLQGNNSTIIATTQFVNTAIADLVNSAPTTLNTLSELATALGNDPNLHTTLVTLIGTKADVSSLVAGLLGKQNVINSGSSVTCGAFTSNSIIDNGNLTVKGNTTLGDLVGLDTLTINGTATFANAPIMSGANISSIPQSAVNNLDTALGNKVSNLVYVSGLALKQDVISGSSSVTCGAFTSNSIVDNGNLTVKGSTIIGDAITDTLAINATTTINANTTFNGSATFTNAPFMSGANISVDSIGQNVINGLDTALSNKVSQIAFTTALASKQDVISGASTISCGAFTSNSIVDNGNLTVKGSTIIGDALTDTLAINATTTINANTTYNGATTFVNAPFMSGANISVDSIGQNVINGLDTALSNKASQTALMIGLASKQDVISGSSSVTCGAFTSNSIIDNGNLTVKGSTIIGDLVGLDTLTVNGVATFTNAPIMSGGNISADSIPKSAVNNLDTALGNKASQTALMTGLASKQDLISGTSALTCGAFTSSSLVTNGNLQVNGNTIIGDAIGSDLLTVNGSATINAITTFSSGPYMSGNHITTGTILKSAVNGLEVALDSKVDSTDFNSWASSSAPKHNATFTGITSSITAITATNTTQLATTEFVQNEIAQLVGGAPLALNTLSEIALALNNDANITATLTNSIALKASQASLVAYQDSNTIALAGKQIAGNYCDASSLQTLGGIKTFTSPIVTSGASISLASIPQSSINGLSTTLSGYQIAGTYCDDSATQVLGGIKTFSSAPVMSGASITLATIPQSSINGLATTLSGKQVAGTYCDATTAQTLGGIKTFSSAPVMSGASITSATIPQSSVVGLVSALSSTGTATNIAGGVASQIPYQSGAGTTLFIPNGTSGQVLTSNGSLAPSWSTATGGSGTTATNLSGGLGGQIHYQSAVNTTSFLANGTTNYVLTSNGGTLAPSWRGAPIASQIYGSEAIASIYYPMMVPNIGNAIIYSGTTTYPYSLNPATGDFTFNSINISASTATSVGIGAGKAATSSVTMGSLSGAGNTLTASAYSTCIGYASGRYGVGQYSVAIGVGAQQGTSTVHGSNFTTAIGAQAGSATTSGMGLNSVALGAYAGSLNQAPNSIIINATGNTNPAQSTTSGLFINPIRGVAAGKGVGIMYYDPVAFEVLYSTT